MKRPGEAQYIKLGVKFELRHMHGRWELHQTTPGHLKREDIDAARALEVAGMLDPDLARHVRNIIREDAKEARVKVEEVRQRALEEASRGLESLRRAEEAAQEREREAATLAPSEPPSR